jgi:hypothetical protein
MSEAKCCSPEGETFAEMVVDFEDELHETNAARRARREVERKIEEREVEEEWNAKVTG